MIKIDAALFVDEPMGLRQRVLGKPLAKRLEWNAEHRLLFINFEGLAVDAPSDSQDIEQAVERLLMPVVTHVQERLAVVVNYDSFSITPALVEGYEAMVRRLSARFYSRVTR